jgi:hypothetical protein
MEFFHNGLIDKPTTRDASRAMGSSPHVFFKKERAATRQEPLPVQGGMNEAYKRIDPVMAAMFKLGRL